MKHMQMWTSMQTKIYTHQQTYLLLSLVYGIQLAIAAPGRACGVKDWVQPYDSNLWQNLRAYLCRLQSIGMHINTYNILQHILNVMIVRPCQLVYHVCNFNFFTNTTGEVPEGIFPVDKNIYISTNLPPFVSSVPVLASYRRSRQSFSIWETDLGSI